jgi:hypothetical protein
MATFIKIASVIVGAGGSTTIDFTSIPQTYTDLLVKVSGRKIESGGSVNLQMQFNGSTTNYLQRALFGNGSTATSYSDNTELGLMYVTSAADTANTFGSTEIYIPNYTASTNKTMSIDSVTENNGTAVIQTLMAGLWSNSAAINRVYLQVGNGASTFTQYTTATLYGIKNN